jgi:hypothetical protein
MTLFHSLDFLATCVPGKLGYSGAESMLAVLESFRTRECISEDEAEYYDYLINQVIEWRKTYLEANDEA